MRQFQLFCLVLFFLMVCVPPTAVMNMVPEGPFNPVTAIFLFFFWLMLYCIVCAVASALVVFIFLVIERLPGPRVRAVLPPLLLVLLAGATLAGVWNRYAVPFPFNSGIPLALAVLTPWPLAASLFGTGRRPWYLVLVAAFTTALFVSLNFFSAGQWTRRCRRRTAQTRRVRRDRRDVLCCVRRLVSAGPPRSIQRGRARFSPCTSPCTPVVSP